MVVLRRLEDATAAGNRVYAVLSGRAVNNDGARRAGFTAPSPRGQAAVIRAALDRAGMSAEDIGYVEAHGTGTRLGDPIELRALAQAHAATGSLPRHCAVGSLKASIGHLDAAAGVAGLIKTALVLSTQQIPPQPGFTTLNPAITLDPERYTVPTRLLVPPGGVLAAGVSSFGLGGCNAHCVLTAAPTDRARAGTVATAATGSAVPGDVAGSPPPESPWVLPLSARDDRALRDRVVQLTEHLRTHPGLRLVDVSHTLCNGRVHLPHRMAVTATDLPAAVAALEVWLLRGCLPEPDARVAAWVAGGRLAPELVPPGSGEGPDRGPGRGGAPRMVSLPPYPWRRERLLDRRARPARPAGRPERRPSAGHRPGDPRPGDPRPGAPRPGATRPRRPEAPPRGDRDLSGRRLLRPGRGLPDRGRDRQ